ncbi:hypothetical protein C0991_002590 [Blastosporella zonata]|nr:hypothetical protein C0991_002590 [Blastosporella zonata]
MRLSAAVLVVSAALAVHAHPTPANRAAAVDGKAYHTTVLNFALTLEHLENAFYKGGLEKYDDKAFAHAGLAPWVRGRFTQIGEHEAAHVAFLSAALGDQATQPCEYSFPHTNAKEFAALSQVLEGVGVSAYTGAAGFIQNKDYLTAAASVLATEARHASWVAAAVNHGSGWSGALDVPLTLDTVYTLAASFITSCPSTNFALPVKAFPALTFATTPVPGASVPVTLAGDAPSDPVWIAFFNGLSQEFAPIKDGKVDVPADLKGVVYAVATTSDTKATDDNIVGGPALLDFKFNAGGNLV